MKIIKEEKQTTILVSWLGTGDYNPVDVAKLIITPPDPECGKVAGIEFYEVEGFGMNIGHAREWLDSLRIAIEIAEEMTEGN